MVVEAKCVASLLELKAAEAKESEHMLDSLQNIVVIVEEESKIENDLIKAAAQLQVSLVAFNDVI